jgi:predicted nucleotidyltransferase component of viral defense system
MILHDELKNLETEWGLREDIIEKDYLLGWVLWGIGADPVLSESGRTLLRRSLPSRSGRCLSVAAQGRGK